MHNRTTSAERSERSPRVLHVVTSSMSHRLMVGQLAFLQENGFEVAGCSSPGPELEELAKTGVRVFAVPMRREIAPLADVLSLWRLYRAIRRFRPDILNTGTPKAGLLGGVAGLLAGVPVRVYTLRGLRGETLRGWKRALVHVTERISCRCAHVVICVSPSLRSCALRLGLVSEKKAVVLHRGSSNGVNVSRFAPTPDRMAAAEAERQRLGIPKAVPVVGFVGRFTRDKGIEGLVEAFAKVQQKVPEARMLLVGEFELGDPVSSWVEGQIKSNPNITWTGFVNDAAGFYHVMDILVLPTRREGFPNAVLEGQAAGKPAITTDATGAVDSVVDGETGLMVKCGDSDALATAILRLIGDPDARQKMGRAGQERVRQHFSNEVVWSSLVNQYRALLEDKSRLGQIAVSPRRVS